MTGQQLIDCIKTYGLEDANIIPNNIFDLENGDCLKFTIEDKESHSKEVSYKVLWLTNDYYQDVIFCKEGELTYGTCNKEERNIIEKFYENHQ